MLYSLLMLLFISSSQYHGWKYTQQPLGFGSISPQPTASPANQEEEILKVYVQQVEEENHNLKQRMDLFKQTAHDNKLMQMGQQ